MGALACSNWLRVTHLLSSTKFPFILNPSRFDKIELKKSNPSPTSIFECLVLISNSISDVVNHKKCSTCFKLFAEVDYDVEHSIFLIEPSNGCQPYIF